MMFWIHFYTFHSYFPEIITYASFKFPTTIRHSTMYKHTLHSYEKFMNMYMKFMNMYKNLWICIFLRHMNIYSYVHRLFLGMYGIFIHWWLSYFWKDASKTLLQHTATHCNTLQHTATHCTILHHTVTYCTVLQHTATTQNGSLKACQQANLLMKFKCVSTRCNTLQHTATHCNTLQHTAAHCSTL